MNKTVKGFTIGFLVGAFLMFSNSLFASSIKEFVLVKAQYPIIVNDNLYEGNLPILNYEGFTYVPLRAISELVGTHIFWNEKLNQVEIGYAEQAIENQAFRNIVVSGFQGNYAVTGEASVFEGTIQYEVEDGHFVLLQGFATASAGGPAWGTFTINIQIPEGNLPQNGLLRLVLFEESAKDGSRINELLVPLEFFS
jgi:hypothetical protein